MLLPEISDDQRELLRAVFDGFRQAASWPTMAYVDLVLDHDHGLDAEDLLNALPGGLVSKRA